MKNKIINLLIGIGVILLTILILPFYLIYELVIAIIELLHTFFGNITDFFEIVRDCLKGKL